MSNRNNLPNHNDDDTGDEVDSSDDDEQNSVVTNVRRPIRLSQPANDEGTTDSRQMTSQQLDIVIVHQPDHREAMISTAYCWFLALLYAFVIYLCWPFMIFAYVAYQLIANDNQPGTIPRRSRSRQSSLQLPYCCGWNRNAKEDRVASPTEDDIPFSATIEMLAPMPLAIQNTQPHDPAVLVNPNNVQQTDAVNNELATPNTHHEVHIQITTDGDRTSQIVIDDSTYNINPLDAIESEDDIRSSESSDEESDQITSSGSGVDGDDENDSADDAEQRGQLSATVQDSSDSVQNNVGSNQTNTADGQPTATGSDPLYNEVVEVEVKVNTPMESARQITVPPTCSTGILIQKLRNPAHSSGESSDEQAA